VMGTTGRESVGGSGPPLRPRIFKGRGMRSARRVTRAALPADGHFAAQRASMAHPACKEKAKSPRGASPGVSEFARVTATTLRPGAGILTGFPFGVVQVTSFSSLFNHRACSV
jgi:hypothetical protein